MGPLSFRQTRATPLTFTSLSYTHSVFFTAVFPPILPTYGTCANFFRTVGAFYDALFFDNLPFSHTRAQTRTHTLVHSCALTLSLSLCLSLSFSLSFSHTHTHTNTNNRLVETCRESSWREMFRQVLSKRVGGDKRLVKSYQNASVELAAAKRFVELRQNASLENMTPIDVCFCFVYFF